MRCLLAAFALAWASAVSAQEAYPSRPISLIVPFPPGGVADIVARAIAPAMRRSLGQPVVVVNRPGAGGSVGAASLANSAADGYNLMIALASISTNPEQERVNNRPAAFELSQLEPIARLPIEPMLLAVRAQSPYKKLQELVEDAKKRPGKIAYASSGVYGVYHVATEMFSHQAGVKLNHIPYNGGAPALLALLSGEVDVGLVTRSVGLKHLEAGTLRPLAAWGSQRWEQFPDLPTVKELGYDVEYNLWSGLFAKAGTPAAVLKKVRDAVRAAQDDSEFKTAMKKSQASLAYLDAPEFRRFWEADAARLGAIVRRIGKLE
ncbi:MAG TPA: tripartite tricarboxylate transporter substrate binding protein [Myxococcaceae bacterium]|nr:tripartite tricarboxylate transporter substrate binding protein [Myxococcaceae bacterium]